MYLSLPRRGASSVAGVLARSTSADAHRGRYAEFVSRHEREAQAAIHSEGRDRERLVAAAFDRIADSRNLYEALDRARRGGEAPGPNGLRLRDLSEGESWRLVRTLRGAILERAYRPGPDRACRIPKASGRGWRTLAVGNVEDRIVQRAVLQVIAPLVEHWLPAGVFGGATGRSHLDALATAARLGAEGYVFWSPADVADAFDNVPRRRLLDASRRPLPSERLQELLESIVGTAGRGLRQGGALSPLLLDLYLATHLDRPWERERPGVKLLRYADDLLVLARSEREAHEGSEAVRERLRRAGLPARRGDSRLVRDVSRDEPCEWLGFRCRLEAGRLAAETLPKSWASLQESLEHAWDAADPELAASEAALGWVSQQGPALTPANRGRICDEVVRRMSALEFEEVVTRDLLEKTAESAFSRWEALRETPTTTRNPTEARGSAHGRIAISHPGDRNSSPTTPTTPPATRSGRTRPAVMCVGVHRPGSPGWWACRSTADGVELAAGRLAEASPATLELTALLAALRRLPTDGWEAVVENEHLVRVLRRHTVHSVRTAVELDRPPPFVSVPRELQLEVFRAMRLGVRLRTPSEAEVPLIREMKASDRAVPPVPPGPRGRSARSS